MGTQLMARGMQPGESPERWNVDRPNDVLAIHQAYAQAGSQWVTTNTFGAHPMALARHGLEDRTEELVRAAVRVARAAGVQVLGDLGPFGDFLYPVGDADPDEVREGFARVVHAMLAEGVDGIVVETMADPKEAALAVAAARAVNCNLPILATFSFQRRGGSFRTWTGATVDDALTVVRESGVSAIGANCGTDLSLDDYRQLAEELLRLACGTPVVMQANAGAPEVVLGSSPEYRVTPAEYGVFARDLIQLGVSWVGGCCGTSPAHIAAIGQTPPATINPSIS